jgi:hypothetical protein
VKGQSETVVVEITERFFDTDFEDVVYLSCVVEVDGEECDSCVVNTCGGAAGGSEEISADCSNIEAGAVYDLCDDDLVVPVGSLFEFLSHGEGEAFQKCFLTESVIPSDAPPVVVPAMIPSDASLYQLTL